MNDDSFVDAHSLLDRTEQWARDSLHDNGYSDTFIDEWIQVDDGLDLEAALELITTEHEYKLMLIRHIEYLRDQLLDGDQTPIDWICNGYLISWFVQAGSMKEIEELWFSELQRKNQKGTRKSTSLAKRAVEFILDKAPELPGGGSDMDRFRHYAARGPRLYGKNIDIEVTAIENNDGKVIEYDFFDNKTFERKIRKEATVRRIIRRLNKQSTEKEGDDPNTGKVS